MFLLARRLLNNVNLIKRHWLMRTKLTANSCLSHLGLILIGGRTWLVNWWCTTAISEKSLIVKMTKAAVSFGSLLLHSLLVNIFCIGLHSHVWHIWVTIHTGNAVCLVLKNLVKVWLFARLTSTLENEVMLVLWHLLIVHVNVLTGC